MLENGFIKLHRSLLKWEWYDDINTKVLFIHLLLTVSIEPQNWHGEMVAKGGRITSYAVLEQETGLSVQKIRTALNKLKSTGELTIKKTSKYSVITINNFEKYQAVTHKRTGNQQATNRQPTNNQQTTNNSIRK